MSWCGVFEREECVPGSQVAPEQERATMQLCEENDYQSWSQNIDSLNEENQVADELENTDEEIEAETDYGSANDTITTIAPAMLEAEIVLSFKKPDRSFVGFSDADWGNDADTRRSNTGYVFQYASGSVSWSC